MKKILLIAGILTFSSASAQSIDTFWVKPIPPKAKNHSLNSPGTYLVNPSQNLIGNSLLLNTLPNGNKVYALPQDNMPCIVPETSHYNMPTVRPEIPLYTIPNPAYPSPAKPGVITQDQLNKLLEKYNKGELRFP